MDWLPSVSLSDVLISGAALAILGLVGALLMGIGWLNHRRAQASRSWPMVLGQVLSAGVATSTDSEGGTSYKPEVRYAYDVAGRQYQNGRLVFGGSLGSGSYQAAQRAAARYAAGSVVPIYYNPANPQEAVLERRSGNTRFFVLFGGFFIVLGCGLFGCVAAVYLAGLVS